RGPIRESRLPARSASAVEDGDKSGIDEHIYTGDRRIALTVYACQICAVRERYGPNLGHVVGDRDAGQTRAEIERRSCDGGRAVGDCVRSSHALRILDQLRLGLVEKDTFDAAVTQIEGIHLDCLQTRAAGECAARDGGDAGWDRDLGQT